MNDALQHNVDWPRVICWSSIRRYLKTP